MTTFLTWLVIFFAGLGLGYWIAFTAFKNSVDELSSLFRMSAELMARYVMMIEEDAIKEKKEKGGIL